VISLNTFKKRIDELGRIVIPKEIRKLYKINNFDELELTTGDNKIVIKKSIGLNLYKEKIKKFLNIINKICDFNIIVSENDIIVESTYDNLRGKLDIDLNDNIKNINMTIKVNDIKISGYMYLDKIIVDSNLLGYIIFIKKDSFQDINLLTSFKNIIIDLIN